MHGFQLIYASPAFYPLSTGYLPFDKSDRTTSDLMLTDYGSNCLVFGYVRENTHSYSMDIVSIILQYFDNKPKSSFKFGVKYPSNNNHKKDTTTLFVDTKGISINTHNDSNINYNGVNTAADIRSVCTIKLSLTLCKHTCNDWTYGDKNYNFMLGVFGFANDLPDWSQKNEYHHHIHQSRSPFLTKNDFFNTLRKEPNIKNSSIVDIRCQECLKYRGFTEWDWHMIEFDKNCHSTKGYVHLVNEECYFYGTPKQILCDTTTLKWDGKTTINMIINCDKKIVQYKVKIDEQKEKDVCQIKLVDNMCYVIAFDVMGCDCHGVETGDGCVFEMTVTNTVEKVCYV